MSKQFSFDTILNFDNHISGSIKGYILLDELIVNVSSFFAKRGERIIDFGCTSGRLISKLAAFYPDCSCIGIDITDHNFIENSNAILQKADITSNDFNIPSCNLALSIFTLQFLSYPYRVQFLKRVYQALNPAGAFIVCEKEISRDGQIQEVMTFANYDYKKGNFTADEILEKEKDLRKIMNCLRFGENENLLRQMIGFKTVEPFFQSLNFRGWICIK
jgi:tRNA (cmo5U34)-methyltransferase